MTVARFLLSPGARRFVSGVSACAALTAAGVRDASAQTPSPLGEWQYSAGVPLQKLFEPNVSTWDISMGAAMTLQPRYAGSDRYRVMGGPTVDIRYRDLFFLSTGEGLGANVLRGPNWRGGIQRFIIIPAERIPRASMEPRSRCGRDWRRWWRWGRTICC